MNTVEANDIALLLRAGALAAPMEIIEERTVGPSLGADNIKKGFDSTIYGFAALSLFIIVYYSLFGVFSALALCANMLFLIALLSMLQATLTLPASPRSRSPSAWRSTPTSSSTSACARSCAGAPRRRPRSTPATSALSGHPRLQRHHADRGTGAAHLRLGPVRGFAVVHCLGILTSIFSSVVVSRSMVNLAYGTRRKLERVAIGNTAWK